MSARKQSTVSVKLVKFNLNVVLETGYNKNVDVTEKLN